MYMMSTRLFSESLKTFLQDEISQAERHFIYATIEQLQAGEVEAQIDTRSLTIPTIDRARVSFSVPQPNGEQVTVNVAVPVAGSEGLLTKLPQVEWSMYDGNLKNFPVDLTDHNLRRYAGTADQATVDETTAGFSFRISVGRDATPEKVKSRATEILDEVDRVLGLMEEPVKNFNALLEEAVRDRADARRAALRTAGSLEEGLSGGL